MKLKRLAPVLLLAGLAFLATGCEWMRWLRLLSLKKQFANLDRYVRVEDEHGLTLHFLKPVVYGDDLRLLVQDETSHTTNGTSETWMWTYEKQSLAPPATPGEFDLSCTAFFENGKFTGMHFPERFLAVMPKPLLLGLLRSMGQAEIDMKHGSVKLKWAGLGKEQLVLPKQAQLVALLGPPFTATESNSTQIFLYKYYQKTPTPEIPADKLAWARFTFATNSGEILSSQGGFGNLGWDMTSVTGETKMRITIALLPLSVEPVALKLPEAITDEYVGQYKDSTNTLLNIGRDGEVFIASWSRDGKGGWCIMAPESTNAFFGVPMGDPRCAFVRDTNGTVTGLVGHLNNSERVFTKVAKQLSEQPSAVPVDGDVYKACAGVYKASWGGHIIIARKDEQLFWQNPGIERRIPLYPASETNFFFKAVDSPLTFVKNEKGNVTKFILHYGKETAAAEKIKSSE